MKIQKIFIALFLFAGMLIIYTCEKDEIAPAGNTFEEVIEIGGIVPPATEDYRVVNSQQSTIETGNSTWNCTTETIEANYGGGGDEGFPLFNPNASVVYPGSMLQGNSLKNATPDIIAVKRAGGVISIDVINGNTLARVEVEEVSKSAISQAANEIIGNSNNIIPANFQFSIEEIQSEQQFATSLKVDFNSSFTDISSELSFSSDQEYNRFIVKLNQSYYTLSFDIPTDLDGLFSPEVTPQDLSKYVGPGNPATYISDVTYGQIYYMLVESTSSAMEMNAALNASFNGLFASGDVNTTVNYMSNLSSLNIKVFGFGGSARSVLLSIGNTNLSEIKDALVKGTDIRAGKPISYVVRNIYDNSIVSVQMNTKYDVTNCFPFVQPNWTSEWNTINDKIGPVGAIFSIGNLYDQGKIFIFNQEGDKFCMSNYNELTGPFDFNNNNDEFTDKLIEVFNQFDYSNSSSIGGSIPFSIGGGTLAAGWGRGPILINKDGDKFVELFIPWGNQEPKWKTSQDIDELFSDYYFPLLSGEVVPSFRKVTAIDNLFLDNLFPFSTNLRCRMFSEGGSFRDYNLRWRYTDQDTVSTFDDINYDLSTTLIDEFQFHGVEAYTSVQVGGDAGSIIVNKAGTEFVYTLDNEQDIRGPFKFYQ